MGNISIALATYNGAHYITEQLNSLIHQSLVPDEIIIVDDCSTDNTLEIIEQFDFGSISVRVLKNIQNLGVIKTFKKSILACNCEYIFLCDQDDIWHQDKLEVCYSRIKTLEKLYLEIPILVISDLKLINANGHSLEKNFWEEHKMKPMNTGFGLALVNNEAVGCSMMFNRSMKNFLYQMPDDILMHDHWIYLISKSFGICEIIDAGLVDYRVHNASVTSKNRFTMLSRFKMIFQNMNDKAYLESHISQAKLFLNVYEYILADQDIEVLNRFISLSCRNYFAKKIATFNLK